MPTDAFTLLQLPPTAALDEETLQSAYLRSTRQAHPDQVEGDTHLSAELNAAVQTLKSPVTRLKHLVEHYSNTPWRAIPLDIELMALFEKLGPLLQTSAVLLKKKQASTSALSRALLAGEEMRLREALEELGYKLDEKWQEIEAQFSAYDTRIAEADATVWADLQTLQAHLAYLAKWRTQIRETLLGLML